jgi:signal transduction histidine kinase
MHRLLSWLPTSSTKKESWYFVIFVIIIIIISYGLFFYLQYSIESDTKTRLVEEQIHNQLKSTEKMSSHIGSDLDAVVLALHGLANSAYLQQGDLSSDKVEKLMQEVYSQLNMFTVVDRLFILDKNNTATVFIVPEEQTDPYFGSDNISFEQLVNQTRATLLPTFTNGFKGLDNVYRVAITFPIVNRQTNEYVGSLAALIPTVRFFEHYGNVHDIESQYLVALDRNATFLTHPLKQNIGTNFFDPDFQQFIKHNRDYNNQIKRVLMLPVFPSTSISNSTSSTPLDYRSRPQGIAQQEEQYQEQQQREKEEKEQGYGSRYAIFDYGIGERLSTGFPILAQMKPAYFIFLVTPTSIIYSHVDQVLLLERIGMFSLLAGTTAAIVLLMVFLLKWNRSLNSEVKRRTKELENSNIRLADANKKLIIRDKMQEEFVNMAAHELRTPLQPIISFSKLALKNKIDKGEAMRGIDKHADRLHKLATNLLAVSRIEGGSLPYKMEKVRINDLILDVANSFVNNVVTAYGAGAARLNVNWNQDRSKKDRSGYIQTLDHTNAIENGNTTTSSKEEIGTVLDSRDSNNRITENTSRLSKKDVSREENQRKIEEIQKQEEIGGVDIRRGGERDGELKQDHEKIPKNQSEALHQQQDQQQQQRLLIDVDLDPEIKEITVDKDRISQVLSNLIDNSIKFTTNSGCCINIQTNLISKSKSELHKVENNNYNDDINGNNDIDDSENSYSDKISIKISDTGGGIPVDILPRLFEKFANKWKKENRQGTGLGLFITKSIITAHNGAIRAYNNDKGGATFSITLPAK